MKRLVYSPEINAWVKTDSGIFDLSPYITSFNITRSVNKVSQAQITFRNPKIENEDGIPRFMFTDHPTVESDGSVNYRPMFHPMDPIVITLTRLKGYPVQVFTGYCDTTPYVQLFPGTASLSASCTLKRLMYTYWDPGLQFVINYLENLGWGGNPESGIINLAAEANRQNNNLNDSSIGYLLYRVLVDVGGWDHNDIYIQSLPTQQINAAVETIYKDLTKDAKASYATFKDFLNKIVGVGYLGGGAGAASDSTGTSDSAVTGTTGGTPPNGWESGEVWEATIYGPPWNATEGGGTTSTGKHLPGPTNTNTMNGPYYFAANPDLIPYGSKWYIWPNPFNYNGTFSCEDTGGAFLSSNDKHIDIFDPRGRNWQNTWGGVHSSVNNNADGPHGGKYVKMKRA